MRSTSIPGPLDSHVRMVSSVVVSTIASLAAPGCFHGPDVSKMVCNDSRYCPSGYVCVVPQNRTQGICERPSDSGGDDGLPPGGLDGAPPVDGHPIAEDVPDSAMGGFDQSAIGMPEVGSLPSDSNLFPDMALMDVHDGNPMELANTSDGPLADATEDFSPFSDWRGEATSDLLSDQLGPFDGDAGRDLGADSPSDIPSPPDLPGCLVNGTFIGEGQTGSCGTFGALGSCASGVRTCTSGQLSSCTIQPAMNDTCTVGNDDNCNGTVDELRCSFSIPRFCCSTNRPPASIRAARARSSTC